MSPTGDRYRYKWTMAGTRAHPHPSRSMNELSVAEIMPVLYRGVLDSVADLEARNGRHEAARIREQAIQVYSRAWNLAAAQRLRSLCEKASRIGMPAVRRSRYAAVLEVLGRVPDGGPALERKPV